MCNNQRKISSENIKNKDIEDKKGKRFKTNQKGNKIIF